MVPKLSAPLAKSIRTGEGILVYATNVVLAVAAALPDGLSWTKAGLYLAILNGANVISRSALKFGALNAGLGIAPPATFDPYDPAHIAAVANAIVSDADELTSQPPVGGSNLIVKPDSARTPDPVSEP